MFSRRVQGKYVKLSYSLETWQGARAEYVVRGLVLPCEELSTWPCEELCMWPCEELCTWQNKMAECMVHVS